MKAFALFLTILGFLFPSIGFSDWVGGSKVSTDDTIGFRDIGGVIENYLVSGTTEASAPYARFGTLEGAVASANAQIQAGQSKVNLYLTKGSQILVENKDIVLSPGVNLYLPYDGKTYDISADSEIEAFPDSFIDTTDARINANRYSVLHFVGSTVKVPSGSTLFIGAKFREKGVSGAYSEITLDANSHIDVFGSFYCYGYVKENGAVNVNQEDYASSNSFYNSFDANRYIEIHSGGYYSTPLAFYDAGSLGELTGLNSKGVFPINTFDFPCAQTYVKVNHGATFEGAVRMFKSSGGQSIPIKQLPKIVKPNGASGNSLLTTTSGYVSFEYCPLKPGYTNADASPIYMTLNGSATIGFLAIDVKVSGITQSISTQDKYLPFSNKFRLIVGSQGNISTSTYKLKLLGGSVLKVLRGGVLDVESSLIGYKGDSTAGGISDYPTTYEDSKIVVNGTMNLSSAASLGGHITTETMDGSATLNFSSVSQSGLKATSMEGLTQTAISIYATGDFFNAETGKLQSYLLRASRTTRSYNGRACWEDDGSLISYVLKISIDNSMNYEHPLVGYKVWKIDTNGTESMMSTDGIYMTVASEYLLEKGESFKVESLNRAEKTEFTKQEGSSYTFSSGTTYAIKGDTEITITPGEGVLVRFSIDGESGSGGSTTEIYESLTSGGTYYQIGQGSSGGAVDIPVKVGAYVKYHVQQGPYKSTKMGDHYLFSGLVIINANDDSGKSIGTKLSTSISNPWLSIGLSKGGTSESTNTQITATSTIHAYIEKR